VLSLVRRAAHVHSQVLVSTSTPVSFVQQQVGLRKTVMVISSVVFSKFSMPWRAVMTGFDVFLTVFHDFWTRHSTSFDRASHVCAEIERGAPSITAITTVCFQ
jgi:hypothetical protein